MTHVLVRLIWPPSHSHDDRARLACAARQTKGGPQKATPNSARYARGATKCVPEQVDRKLNSASLFVTFSASNRIVQRTRSVWNRLSVPTPMLNKWRERTRAGFLSSFSVPGAGMFTSFVPQDEELQVVIGTQGVAT